MSSTEASLRIPAPTIKRFAPHHKRDRNFFLLWILLTALGRVDHGTSGDPERR